MIRLHVTDVKGRDYSRVEVLHMTAVPDIIYSPVSICNACNRCTGYYITPLLDNSDAPLQWLTRVITKTRNPLVEIPVIP